MTYLRAAALIALLEIAAVGGYALIPPRTDVVEKQQVQPEVVSKIVGNYPPARLPVVEKITQKGPDPQMVALAAGASNWSVAAANLHIIRTLERVRLDAVAAGVDPDAAAREFTDREIVNWRFATWHSVAREVRMRIWQRMDRWWVQQTSTGPVYVAPVEVPGTHGLLWQLDIRDYGWNARAWRAVALRETFTRAAVDDYGKFVGVDIHQIDLLQRFIGEKRIKVTEKLLVNGKTVELDTFPAIGVVRADWLFRDTIETDRSPSYYDLLYARARFPEKVTPVVETYTEKQPYTVREQVYDARYGGYVYRDVTHYREVKFTRPAKAAKGNQAVVDFPRDRNDWDEFWGIKALRDFARKQKFDLRYGAVVPGSRDDPRGGSIVARNNRVVAFWDNGALETIDVQRTSRRDDFIEQPVEVSLDQIDGENGEFLVPLRNGGQATLLIARKKRVEFATGNFVQPHFADKRNPDVRTPQCLVCHAGSGGVIPPRNLFAEYLAGGIDLKIKDRIQRNQVRAFMLDWEHRLKGWQAPYLKLIERATLDGVDGKTLTPAELVREFLALRDWYDDPVTPEQAAWELGIDVDYLKYLTGKTTTGRARALNHGQAIPREVWEKDVYLWLLAQVVRK